MHTGTGCCDFRKLYKPPYWGRPYGCAISAEPRSKGCIKPYNSPSHLIEGPPLLSGFIKWYTEIVKVRRGRLKCRSRRVGESSMISGVRLSWGNVNLLKVAADWLWASDRQNPSNQVWQMFSSILDCPYIVQFLKNWPIINQCKGSLGYVPFTPWGSAWLQDLGSATLGNTPRTLNRHS